MDIKNTVTKQLHESAEIKQQIAETCVPDIEKLVHCICESLKSGGKILLCGNGGSAADSQHIAAELVGRFQMERDGFAAIALTTDTSILTSLGNDYGFQTIFQRQVEALGKSGDVLIGLSTSGQSENVALAMKTAKSMNIKTVAFMGRREGGIKDFADISIQIPSDNTARVQEGHITVAHIMCDLIEKMITGKDGD